MIRMRIKEQRFMANIKSAVKRARQSEGNRVRNRACRSTVLTARKKVLEAITAGNKEEAQKIKV